MLGYLLAGIAIGPYGLDLVAGSEDVMHFAEFGVVLMLFLVGLELSPSRLWRLRGPVLGLGGLQVFLTAAVIAAIAAFLALPWRECVAIGLILALSSTAIVLQSLSEKGLLGTVAGRNAFSVLLFQDVAVIPILALLPLLATRVVGGDDPHEHHSWVSGLSGFAYAGVVLLAIFGIVLAGRFVVGPLFRLIGRTGLREIFTAAALLLVVGLTLLMTEIGLSPALGTFLGGVVLANSEYRHQLETDIEPFKGLLLGLFFVAVGGAIDFALIVANPWTIALLVSGLMVLKFVILAVLGFFFRMALDQRFLFAVSLAQGGEFCFVLLGLALRQGVLDERTSATLVAVVAVSMALTPIALLVFEKLVRPRFGTRESQSENFEDVSETNPVIIAGFGRFGHIIGRLLTANGIGCTVLDIDSDHVDTLRKIQIPVYYGDASRPDLLRAAGAEEARLLIVATDDPAKINAIVHVAQEHFPHLKILARARGRPHAYELLDMGVDHVYRETLDTSLRLGADALRMMGVRAYRARRAATVFREYDEAGLREMASLWHDRRSYFNRARQRNQELERVLNSDRTRTMESDDKAWDSDCIAEDFGGDGKSRSG